MECRRETCVDVERSGEVEKIRNIMKNKGDGEEEKRLYKVGNI